MVRAVLVVAIHQESRMRHVAKQNKPMRVTCNLKTSYVILTQCTPVPWFVSTKKNHQQRDTLPYYPRTNIPRVLFPS